MKEGEGWIRLLDTIYVLAKAHRRRGGKKDEFYQNIMATLIYYTRSWPEFHCHSVCQNRICPLNPLSLLPWLPIVVVDDIEWSLRTDPERGRAICNGSCTEHVDVRYWRGS